MSGGVDSSVAALLLRDAGHPIAGTERNGVEASFAELYRMGAVASGEPLDDTMARIEAESGRGATGQPVWLKILKNLKNTYKNH